MKKKYWNSVHKTGCHKKGAIFSFLLPPLSQIDFNLKTLEIFFLVNFKSQKLLYYYNFPPRRIIVDYLKKK